MDKISELLLTLNAYSPLLLVIATIILVIITGIYAYFIYYSFKLSKKDYEVRNRPYLTIEKDISLPLGEGGTQFLFLIKNSGNTPAQVLSYETVFLECDKAEEKFSNPYNRKKLNQRAILAKGQNTTFTVKVPSDEKIGLEIKIKYKGIVFRKVFGTKVLFKLEKRMVFPIDSFVF
ncbi:MAG: hypothetical protein V1788_00220 [Nanoarchaeota archaeon]|nr:hypothetical protein [Nanoarchaeota archaeon]